MTDVLQLPLRSLLIFIDETGNEDLSDPKIRRSAGAEAHWAGVVTDIKKGANSYVTGLALIEILIIDVLNNDLTKERAKHVVDAVWDDSFDDRPSVFDIIAQAAYYSYLMEKDGTATAGTANLFLNDIANWFSDQPEHQKRVHDYLLESTMRFRASAQNSVQQA
jgi:hypothetical protein